MTHRPVAMLLFDLDGTLIDSRHDLTTALNRMLREMELPAVSLENVTRFVGDGAQMLVNRGLTASLGRAATDAEIAEGLRRFKAAYADHLTDSTTCYPHVHDVLDAFAAIPKAVVTNKPHGFSVKILEALGIADRFAVVIGGDSLPTRKPDPAPVLAALDRCGVSPAEAVMIGDSPNDIESGRAAGTITCGVSYGLRSRAELEASGADVIVDSLPELNRLFQPLSGKID